MNQLRVEREPLTNKADWPDLTEAILWARPLHTNTSSSLYWYSQGFALDENISALEAGSWRVETPQSTDWVVDEERRRVKVTGVCGICPKVCSLFPGPCSLCSPVTRLTHTSCLSSLSCACLLPGQTWGPARSQPLPESQSATATVKHSIRLSQISVVNHYY